MQAGEDTRPVSWQGAAVAGNGVLMRDTLGDPRLVWRDDETPVSGVFDDVYFSVDGGDAESRHVFLDGCDLPRSWQGRAHYTIAETGFGTGLNFLLTWKAWLDDPARSQFLDYVSVEGFPLPKDALCRALSAFPALAPLAEQLVAVWPRAFQGAHVLMFAEGRVRLHLRFGEVGTALARLSARVDAWFLDGFAPSRNPDMWRSEVLQSVASLSVPGARLASFTAAGPVRRTLESLGFRVEKRRGYGRKRECIAAVLQQSLPSCPHPWFRRPAPLRAGARIAIIGAGIGGCSAAAALKRRDFDPVLVDCAGQVGQGASGNPCGLLKPRLTLDQGIHGRFYGLAFLHTLRVMAELEKTWPDLVIGRGILSVARSDDEYGKMAALAPTLPPGVAVPVDSVEAHALAGIGVSSSPGGLWFPDALSIRPLSVCQALSADIPLVQGEVTALDRTASGWLLKGTGIEADAVVLAAGPYLPRLCPEADLPVRANRGHISFMPEVPGLPDVALSFGGYLSPAVSGTGDVGRMRVLGATYDRWIDIGDNSWAMERADDARRSLDLLGNHVPTVADRWQGREPCGGRISLRATIADHMPMVGPLFRVKDWQEAYRDLHHGRSGTSYPQAPLIDGLYVLGALGSRGFQTAFLLAEALGALCDGSPLPLDTDLYEALHPGRFAIRALRRRPR